jgi:hypothetical protein
MNLNYSKPNYSKKPTKVIPYTPTGFYHTRKDIYAPDGVFVGEEEPLIITSATIFALKWNPLEARYTISSLLQEQLK